MARGRRQRDEQGQGEQAQQAREALQDAQQHEQSIHEGDSQDLQQNMEQDYRPVQQLDRYQQEGLNDQQQGLDSQSARFRAQQELNQRQRLRRLGGIQAYQMMQEQKQDIRRFRQYEDQQDIEQDQGKLNKYLDHENAKGKLPDWISQQHTQIFIRKYFLKFISSFKDSGRSIYNDAFVTMCTQNKQTLQIQLEHLMVFQATLGYWIGMYPALILPKLHEALYKRACKLFKGYKTVHQECFVRIRGAFVIDVIRKLRHSQISKMVYLKGVVTFRSAIFSQMKEVYFKCKRAQCGNIKGPFFISQASQLKHGKCMQCQGTSFKIEQSLTLYRNYQTVVVQQKPQDVEPGRVPRHKEVVVQADLADKVKPGDQVEVIGTYSCRYSFSLTALNNHPVLYTFIDCNNIYQDSQIKAISNMNSKKILEISKAPNLIDLLIDSSFPSIFGHYNTKKALLLSLFGGVQVQYKDHRIRGDINVIMVGDPGTAKSQMLKSIQAISPRAMYTTGKGASAVGLTASVRMNLATNEWGIEAGALVLADRGVCIIDQFDKMKQSDRSAIHEAMQQQSISIAKAGLVSKLNARCSVIAASNPVKGRYDRSITFRQNVDLSQPILSRFDILCVIQDQIDQDIDQQMSTFILNSHMKNHPINSKLRHHDNLDQFDLYFRENKLQQKIQKKNLLTLEEVKTYIAYAKQNIKPKLKQSQKEKFEKFYVALRKESNISGGTNIVTRHIQSMVRMAYAHAKIHLRNEVIDYDIDVSMRMMLDSFIQTQKPSIARNIQKTFRTLIA